MMDINYDKGIMNFGDNRRLENAMLKAMSGEAVTVGFLGGSITQGCLSSVPETCYAYLVYSWWKEKFPKSSVTYINAGIGGTPSDFGVARVEDDLLRFKPDFVIVEFSVNDENTFHYMETYEGLVRHILKFSSDLSLMLVHNVKYDDMSSAEDKHLIIGKYYDLPDVSMKHTLYPLVASGSVDALEVTKDYLHPNDLGHSILAKLIINYLEKVYENASNIKEPHKIDTALFKPLTLNDYENGARLNNLNSKPVINGFKPDESPQSHITEIFRHGYTSWKEGDRITFTASCSAICVQYRKSVNKPAPIALAIVDGDEDNAVVLDANFDEDWGDCLYTQLICERLERKEHSIEIKIVADHSKEKEKDAVAFYLVSVIAY